jgi:hypothetical protein
VMGCHNSIMPQQGSVRGEVSKDGQLGCLTGRLAESRAPAQCMLHICASVELWPSQALAGSRLPVAPQAACGVFVGPERSRQGSGGLLLGAARCPVLPVRRPVQASDSGPPPLRARAGTGCAAWTSRRTRGWRWSWRRRRRRWRPPRTRCGRSSSARRPPSQVSCGAGGAAGGGCCCPPACPPARPESGPTRRAGSLPVRASQAS